MRRGTTPTIVIHVKRFTFQGCQLLVTIRQLQEDVGAYPKDDNTRRKWIFPITLNKSGSDVSIGLDGKGGCYVSCDLTQEETLKFATGQASVQLRWIDESGKAGSSLPKKIFIDPTLSEGVIKYG